MGQLGAEYQKILAEQAAPPASTTEGTVNPTPAVASPPAPTPTATAAPSGSPPATGEGDLSGTWITDKQEVERLAAGLQPTEKDALSKKLKGLEKGFYAATRDRAELRRELEELRTVKAQWEQARQVFADPRVAQAFQSALNRAYGTEAAPETPPKALEEMSDAERIDYLRAEQARTLDAAQSRLNAEKLTPLEQRLTEIQERLDEQAAREELSQARSRHADFEDYWPRIQAFIAEHPEVADHDTFDGLYYRVKGENADQIQADLQSRERQRLERFTTEKPNVSAAGTASNKIYPLHGGFSAAFRDQVRDLQARGMPIANQGLSGIND